MPKRKCRVVTFIEDGTMYWVCPDTMGSRIPRKTTITKCWKYNCPGIYIEPDNDCANERCNNKKAENSRYCSQACRHRKNQRDYKRRKREKCQNTTNT